ncbi:glutaredoxin family protein [Paenibacillus athensensis]|uniref:Glutaredoxin domain-containing protein n=1 Tax=Paenibacillus athensensis TaxID=1967502 RepID=A0A4Y8QA01_9BACL|nr:glutaredoxin family protein [Paenibacillus athensensis]MCD1258975.1 glutaredoxin family protein [Paenibacillus athensensis]
MKQVTVYISDGCVACEETIAYLQSRGVAPAIRNIAAGSDVWKELLALGGIATPLLVIGGTVLHTLNKRVVDQLLEEDAGE